MNPYPHIKYPVILDDPKITIYQINDHIWLFQGKEGVHVSFYAVEGSEKTMVIDSGHVTQDIKSYISKVTKKPQMLVLTHGHHDHVGGVNEYDTIYIHKGDKSLIHNYKGTIIEMNVGDVFDIGNIHLTIFDLAAHTLGSVGILDVEDRCIFTGDGVGSCFLWMWVCREIPLEGFLKILKAVEQMQDKFDTIFVGHMNTMILNNDITYIKKVISLVEKILYSEEKIPTTPYEPFDFWKTDYADISPVSAQYDGLEIIYNPANLFYKQKK